MKVQVYLRDDLDWGWRTIADNGQTIATSGEGYEHKDHAEHMAREVNPGVEVEVVE